jgi:NADH-quinone oxidoreductase subunit F
MTIAAFATGCEQGFIYIRGEYPLARERCRTRSTAARARASSGDNIMGQARVRHRDPARRGAYICGEETRVFNSIEGCAASPATSRRSRHVGVSASRR